MHIRGSENNVRSLWQRANLGDPAFLSNITDFEKRMLSPETAAAVRQKITATTHNVSYYNPDGIESLNTHGTSGVVTADSSGMAISLTTTVNLLFGSQVIVPETGVIMNDEMNGRVSDFALTSCRKLTFI